MEHKRDKQKLRQKKSSELSSREHKAETHTETEKKNNGTKARNKKEHKTRKISKGDRTTIKMK